MEGDGTGNIEVPLEAVPSSAEDGVISDDIVIEVDLKESLEKNNSTHSLPKSFRKNKPLRHNGGIFSQQLWINEFDSDTSPSFIDSSSSTSSKSEEESGLDNKSTVSSGSLSVFLENHAHLLPQALLKKQSSVLTIKASGSRKPSFAVGDLEETESTSATLDDDSSVFSLKLMHFQDTLRSARGRGISMFTAFGYDSDDDEDLDKILGPAKRTKLPKQPKTLSAWNASIAAGIAAKQGKRTVSSRSTLPPMPEEPMKEKKDKSLADLPRIHTGFSEDTYGGNIDQMDYSTVSGSTLVDHENDVVVYEHGDSPRDIQRDPLEKYRKRRKRRCLRIALRAFLCTMVAAVVTAGALFAIYYFQGNNEVTQGADTQDVDNRTYVFPEAQTQHPSQTLGLEVSPEPTVLPTQKPSRQPTETPTMIPSALASGTPSTSPSISTPSPTSRPTMNPTPAPTRTQTPTWSPAKRPTPIPTTMEYLVTSFYVVGDLPYNDDERTRLIEHVNNLPDDAEFLIHVGDIRDAESKQDCQRSEFQDVANILKQSPVPVFIVPGDNEYNDCPNLDRSWGDYLAEFGKFEKNWDTQLRVFRDPINEENFYFVHKRVLYIGLNVVGGWRHDYAEWERRLDMGWLWTRNLIETYVRSVPSDASSIVIFAHADPRPSAHAPFFDPLKQYIRDELKNEVPILYVNGDQHYWQFDSNFYGEPSFHRIMVEGGSKEPALKMTMVLPDNPYQGALDVNNVYSFDRRL